ncbi:MAG: hypothetical protein ACLFVK_03940 [Dehalococcoidia bacterium]
MEKDQLLEMAMNRELIPGIYNYCDRWCERCSFTSRCLQFQMQENEDQSSGSPVRGEDKVQFWERVEEMLSLAMELIRDFADREGIDLNVLAAQAEMAEQEESREAACNH